MQGPVFLYSGGLVEYDKPHLRYDQQVRKLAGRGMLIDDEAEAVQLMKRVGYYRFSGYTYAFRQRGEDSSGPRKDDFVEGTCLDSVAKLYKFDEELRKTLLAGLHAFEVSLGVQIGYELGKKSVFGHLRASELDSGKCNIIRKNSGGSTDHEIWLRKYDEAKRQAATEDFMKHFEAKYGGVLPVWVATEVMTFGNLVRLYSFLPGKVQAKVAKAYGLEGRKIASLSSWLLSLNTLRNHAAHGARLWNRVFAYPLKQVERSHYPQDLRHLVELPLDRIYSRAAILMYFLRASDPQTRWHVHFKEAAKKFPTLEGLTLESDSGFADDWKNLDLWQGAPSS